MRNLVRLVTGIAGLVVSGVGISVFLVPAAVPALGVGGLGVIAREVFGFPVGLTVLALNVPVMVVAYYYMPGGWRMLANIALTMVGYSLAIDLVPLVWTEPVTDDRLLNALYGGLALGVGGGLVYRSNFVLGGTYVLALILRKYTGTPLNLTYLYTDALVLVLAAFVFGLEGALFGAIVLFVNGSAQDYVMEGPSVVRTAMIVTDQPVALSTRIMHEFNCGVTRFRVEGMYQRQERDMLQVTLSRASAERLRTIVSEVDDAAFMVIGVGHVAYGGGFRPMVKRSLV